VHGVYAVFLSEVDEERDICVGRWRREEESVGGVVVGGVGGVGGGVESERFEGEFAGGGEDAVGYFASV
jgi:hypothetical protein